MVSLSFPLGPFVFACFIASCMVILAFDERERERSLHLFCSNPHLIKYWPVLCIYRYLLMFYSRPMYNVASKSSIPFTFIVVRQDKACEDVDYGIRSSPSSTSDDSESSGEVEEEERKRQQAAMEKERVSHA